MHSGASCSPWQLETACSAVEVIAPGLDAICQTSRSALRQLHRGYSSARPPCRLLDRVATRCRKTAITSSQPRPPRSSRLQRALWANRFPLQVPRRLQKSSCSHLIAAHKKSSETTPCTLRQQATRPGGVGNDPSQPYRPIPSLQPQVDGFASENGPATEIKHVADQRVVAQLGDSICLRLSLSILTCYAAAHELTIRGISSTKFITRMADIRQCARSLRRAAPLSAT